MSLQTIPYIPEDAPFSTDQRAWLNGFLAGLFSNAPAPQESAAREVKNVAIYFATQSGTAERLAKKFAKELKTAGHTATIASTSDLTPEQLAQQSHAVFFVSTYGDGEPPDHARGFHETITRQDHPLLPALLYTVFALGDRNYEQFCAFGAQLDERLAALGATRILQRVESDVDVDEHFTAWKTSCLAALDSKPAQQGQTALTGSAPTPAASLYTRDNPCYAQIVERRALTAETSGKLTMHLALKLNDDLSYEVGDACGVLAQNDPALVDETLSLLSVADDELVTVPRVGQCTAREALLHHYQHTRLTRKIVQAFADHTKSKVLTGLLLPEQATHLDAYMYDRGLIDLLHEFPGAIETAEALFSILPRLSPRLYSISSSPARHGLELHCTIGVVKYRSHNRERGGVASTMLAERVAIGERVPIYIQPNKKFRLPSNSDTPIIMIGPGTGIAPFRAFLHEREALRHKGRNWLFFGERSAQTDFLYREELRSMCDNGHLTRLDTAFSRDQARKIYVQDRMLEQGAALWQWLQDDARLYVCGDATRMAKDVDAALHNVIQTHGNMDADQARDYVSQMQDEGRYHRDVY